MYKSNAKPGICFNKSVALATAIDDNAADWNLYKLFGEISMIYYISILS